MIKKFLRWIGFKKQRTSQAQLRAQLKKARERIEADNEQFKSGAETIRMSSMVLTKEVQNWRKRDDGPNDA